MAKEAANKGGSFYNNVKAFVGEIGKVFVKRVWVCYNMKAIIYVRWLIFVRLGARLLMTVVLQFAFFTP